jgi:hypothetical protein
MKSDGRSVRFNSIIFQSFEDCCLILLLNASKYLLTWLEVFQLWEVADFFIDYHLIMCSFSMLHIMTSCQESSEAVFKQNA